MSFLNLFFWLKHANNGKMTLECSLVVAYKDIQRLAHESRYSTLNYIFKIYKNTILHNDLHMNIFRIFFKIALKWKQPQYPSICEWINKLWIFPQQNTITAITRNKLLNCGVTWN